MKCFFFNIGQWLGKKMAPDWDKLTAEFADKTDAIVAEVCQQKTTKKENIFQAIVYIFNFFDFFCRLIAQLKASPCVMPMACRASQLSSTATPTPSRIIKVAALMMSKI